MRSRASPDWANRRKLTVRPGSKLGNPLAGVPHRSPAPAADLFEPLLLDVLTIGHPNAVARVGEGEPVLVLWTA